MANFRIMWGMALLSLSVCQGQTAGGPDRALELNLQKAIEIALSKNGNTDVRLAQESVNVSHFRYAEARSGLLPNFDGSVTEQDQTINLHALGIRFSTPPGSGFTIPTEVGPFNTFDARLHFTQNLLNVSTIRHSQAAHADVHAAEADTQSVGEQVAATVARLYAASLRAEADVANAQANVALAQELRDQAGRRQNAGEATALDVTRAELSMSRNQQRLLAAQTVLIRANLELIKALNIDWNTSLHLGGKLGSVPAQLSTPAEAMEVALRSRPEFLAERRRMEGARLGQSAARAERLPSLVGFADYGLLSGIVTHTAGASLRVPLFDGGRIDAERGQANALLRQEEIRQRDLKNQVELEVRQALASLASAQSQLQVAERAVGLAQDELGRARRRYDAGLATSLDVLDAETRVENALNDRVAAEFNCTEANIDFAQATGTIKSMEF